MSNLSYEILKALNVLPSATNNDVVDDVLTHYEVKEKPFELKHDMRDYEYIEGIYGVPFVKVLHAVQEIQEWIYAQENK